MNWKLWARLMLIWSDDSGTLFDPNDLRYRRIRTVTWNALERRGIVSKTVDNKYRLDKSSAMMVKL